MTPLQARITPTLVSPFLFMMTEVFPFLAAWTFLFNLAFLTAAWALTFFFAGDLAATLDADLGVCFGAFFGVDLVAGLVVLVFEADFGVLLVCGLATVVLVTLATAFFADPYEISYFFWVLTFGLAVGFVTGFLVIDFLTAEDLTTDLLLDGLAVAFLVEAVLVALLFLMEAAVAFGISNFF